jgi:protein-S-isoprenylcysteine O-methyltransferase Ste14
VALFLTARRDEDECKHYFGAEYVDYMSRTRLFVPFVF